MISKGDYVQVLDEAEEGVVIEVKGDVITVETKDGFLLNYAEHELLRINKEQEVDFKSATTKGYVQHALDEKVEPIKRSFVKDKKSKKEEYVVEVDLHIEKLVKNHHRLEKYAILDLQLDTARGQLEFAISNRIPRLVFIHGVGEGILRAELEFLFSRYPQVVYEDANYQKYGLGAMQIYIKQNA